jgi:restriction endonuclease S subunit
MLRGNIHPRIGNEDVANLFIPVPDETTQRKIAAETQTRRDTARTLHAEAETEWAAAKARFESELIGGAI